MFNSNIQNFWKKELRKHVDGEEALGVSPEWREKELEWKRITGK